MYKAMVIWMLFIAFCLYMVDGWAARLLMDIGQYLSYLPIQ